MSLAPVPPLSKPGGSATGQTRPRPPWSNSADAHILESWLLVRSQAGSTAPDTRRPQRVGFLGSFQNLCSWTVVSEVERSSDQVWEWGGRARSPKGGSGRVQQEPVETAGPGYAAPSGSSFLRAPAHAWGWVPLSAGQGRVTLGSVTVVGAGLFAGGPGMAGAQQGRLACRQDSGRTYSSLWPSQHPPHPHRWAFSRSGRSPCWAFLA